MRPFSDTLRVSLPLRALAESMLITSLLDIDKQGRHTQSALTWIRKNDDFALSFNNVCMACGLNPNYIRALVDKICAESDGIAQPSCAAIVTRLIHTKR